MIADKRFENLESLYDTHVKNKITEDTRIIDVPDENERDILVRKQQELRKIRNELNKLVDEIDEKLYEINKNILDKDNYENMKLQIESCSFDEKKKESMFETYNKAREAYSRHDVTEASKYMLNLISEFGDASNYINTEDN